MDGLIDGLIDQSKLLVVCLQVVEHEDESSSAEDTESPAATQCVDIDDALQDNLCKLWDMSMNPVSCIMYMLTAKIL